MNYPMVLSEDATLEAALAGRSLARYGDGEFKLAIGKKCVSQDADPALAEHLKLILKSARRPDCLVCIPNLDSDTPKRESWENYRADRYTALLSDGPYGSSFITRPDSAPWIDRPGYWDKVRQLWAGRDVVLVHGGHNALTPEALSAARSVHEIVGPRTSAYGELARLEAEILAVWRPLWQAWLRHPDDERELGRPRPVVIMCLGAAATVLAWRLSGQGVQALDLGHMGLFMRHAGAYRFQRQDLISDAYRRQLELLRATRKWGGDGAKHAETVDAFAREIGAASVLDYGCGLGDLGKALEGRRRVMGYDPGIPEKAILPKPADLVVCADVLEHVEPDRLPNVIDHINRLAAKAAYLVIATRPANAILPDGRNAHLIVEDADWWLAKVASAWPNVRTEAKPGKELRVWLWK